MCSMLESLLVHYLIHVGSKQLHVQRVEERILEYGLALWGGMHLGFMCFYQEVSVYCIFEGVRCICL